MISSTSQLQETARGFAIEALPNAQFIVELDDGRRIRAYVAGKMRRNKIRVGLGEKVEIELIQTGDVHRIIKRL